MLVGLSVPIFQMAQDKSYTIVALPRDTQGETNFKMLVARARDFRLQSLQLAPESFGIAYESEVNREPEFWTNRVANPKATTFIACRYDQTKIKDAMNDHVQAVLDAEWLGSIILLGPKYGVAEFALDTSPWKIIGEDSRHDRVSEPIRHYLINGMFVMPTARGLGLGKALMTTALENAEKQTRSTGGETKKCTIVVDKYNDPARHLYLRSGFKVIKEEMFTPEVGKHRPALTMELTKAV